MDLASRITRLQLPERVEDIGLSVGAAERELLTWPTGDGVLNLTHADTHRFPPPAWVIEDFVAAATGGGRAYTAFRGDPSVLEPVARNVGRFLGLDLDPHRDLILTPGSQGGLFGALAALIEPGDRVALVDPDYLSTERTLRFLGADVDLIPLLWQDGTPSIDLDALRASFTGGARLMVFSHPNNPTGAVYEPGFLDELAALAEEFDVTLVVDQLYSRLVYDGRPFRHLIADPRLRDRCVTSLGPSKTESMSGYRLGVLVAPPQIVDAIEDVTAITAIRAPAYAQWTLPRWLDEDQEFLRQRTADYQSLRDTTVDAFRALPFAHVEIPRGTTYAFVDVTQLNLPDQEVARRLLNEARVAVNPGYQFGPGGIGSFRVCFAQDDAVWGDVLARVTETLSALASSRA
jgi:aspartate/methionine/tyrosine aminotransferase